MTEYVLFNKERDAYLECWPSTTVKIEDARRFASQTAAVIAMLDLDLSGYEAVPVEGKGQKT